MTLPFELPEKNKRKYQCFVCGKEFFEYSVFKTHIIEQHSEGRDYVLCPLKRCQAPVRDVKSHFKAKHPSEKMPPCKQMKAIIWRDLKGKKMRHKVHFTEGSFTSWKMNGKEIHYRSGYERDVYKCLEMFPEVIAYDTEKVEVPYWFEGERHTYLPDLQIAFADGSIELWEIKPESQNDLPVNVAKWEAARDYCLIRGWKFQVLNESEINQLKNKLRLLLKEGQ